MIFPPWGSELLWKEANWTIKYLHQRHHHALHRAKNLGKAIHGNLQQLFPLMESLCEAACPQCRACCCRRAKPYFDFRDLIYLHLQGKEIPAAQPIGSTEDHCQYHLPNGCLLPRSDRPWICTWYTCPAHRALLPEGGWDMTGLDDQLREIKKLRGELEKEFIRVVAWPAYE